jgi:hypothetical protein
VRLCSLLPNEPLLLLLLLLLPAAACSACSGRYCNLISPDVVQGSALLLLSLLLVLVVLLLLLFSCGYVINGASHGCCAQGPAQRVSEGLVLPGRVGQGLDVIMTNRPLPGHTMSLGSSGPAGAVSQQSATQGK